MVKEKVKRNLLDFESIILEGIIIKKYLIDKNYV